MLVGTLRMLLASAVQQFDVEIKDGRMDVVDPHSKNTVGYIDFESESLVSVAVEPTEESSLSDTIEEVEDR